MAMPVVILSSDSEPELDDIFVVNQARGQQITSLRCRGPASTTLAVRCCAATSKAACECRQDVCLPLHAGREHRSGATRGGHVNDHTLTDRSHSPYVLDDSSISSSNSGRSSAELRACDDGDTLNSGNALPMQVLQTTVDASQQARVAPSTACDRADDGSSDDGNAYNRSVAGAASQPPAGGVGESSNDESSDCESSDDGDFYSKSVSDIFSKRQLCASTKSSAVAKKARLSPSLSSLHTAPDSPSLDHASSVDDSFDEGRPVHRMPTVRTPSPPPELKPRSTQRRRADLVSNAISELERYKDVSQQLSADCCEVASPVEATVGVRQRTVFIMVKLHSSTEKFRIGTGDALSRITTTLAEKENVSATRIALYFNDSQVAASDTPASLGLKTGEMLECVILPPDDLMQQGNPTLHAQSDDVIQLKVQDRSGQRSRTVMNVNKKAPLRALMLEFALKKGVSVDSLAFHFDGDELSETATCDDIGLEDGFCIDVSTR